LKSNNNIVLIGFVGCGRNCVGKDLASELDSFFVDTQSLTDSLLTKECSDFEKEDIYKRAKKWLSSTDNTIISAKCDFAVLDEISKLGHIIYLKVPFDELKEIDIEKDEFEKKDEIFREKADFIIDGKMPKESILKTILWEL